jgi:hypothetical protein
LHSIRVVAAAVIVASAGIVTLAGGPIVAQKGASLRNGTAAGDD